MIPIIKNINFGRCENTSDAAHLLFHEVVVKRRGAIRIPQDIRSRTKPLIQLKVIFCGVMDTKYGSEMS